MKKFLSAILSCAIVLGVSTAAFASELNLSSTSSAIEQKQEEINAFTDEVNAQYGTYYYVTFTSDTASFEELNDLKEFITQQAKEQKEIREQIKALEINSLMDSREGIRRFDPGTSISKNTSTTTSLKASSGSNKVTLKFKIGAKVTYDNFGFSDVTAIFSSPVTTGLDWKQKSGAGHIFGDDEYVNISAIGDYHYLRNGVRLDAYDTSISAPICISDIR